jgi:response regulator of citrate/malate metabolism
MEKISNRKQAILDVMDSEIQALEEKLRKVQPQLDELNQLRRARATLLSERSVTGGVRTRANGQPSLTMEEVIHAMNEAEGPLTVDELTKALGRDATVVRSHLNRHRGTRYERDGDGWSLIGADEDEDDE